MRTQGARLSATIGLSFLAASGAAAVGARETELPPLLPEPAVAALANELSGASAKRDVQQLAMHHRIRGSRGFRAAAEHIRRRLEAFGLEPELLELPADGEIFYGTQRSRPAWDAEFAELWELPSEGDSWIDGRRIASWAARPITLAQDSASGSVTADLVDVGEGTSPEDYEGKEVAGGLVLAGAQPGRVAEIAIKQHGAAGIVSYAPNQRTAWWKEDETLVRWGHLDTFPAPATFAFMVSLKQARSWRERLARGERVRLRAVVEAGQHPGSYDIVTAVIPGRDARLKDREIVFSCHLDHQLPGANDNVSGCAAILEVARAVSKLIHEGRIDAPRRSIRFVWPPEVEGTIALLNARPGIAAKAVAVIHMDMVGGGPRTKAIFHVTRSPKSLPTFVDDVAEAYGRFVNAQTSAFAGGRDAAYPLVDPEGGKEALGAEMADFSLGSDHQVWAEGSFRVPAIYLNDWPDRFIHTHADSVDNIDPTKLLRAAFIGAASGLYLARLDADGVGGLWQVMRRHGLERTARALARHDRIAAENPSAAANLMRFHFDRERAAIESIGRFAAVSGELRDEAMRYVDHLQRLAHLEAASGPAGGVTAMGRTVYRRAPTPKGPMAGFGYNYLEDRLSRAGLDRPALLDYRGRWGAGAEYAYEALNLVDARRSVSRIRDDLSGIYGEVPLELVAEYLGALEAIGVLLAR